MSERVFILSLWIRLWHWANAILILLLILSGASLHFSDAALPLLPFAVAVKVHNVAGLALTAMYAVFVVGNIVSGNWWQYVPKPGGFLQRCWAQTRFYCWGIFAGEPHPYPPTPAANFNSLQQIIYWLIMYMLMPALIVTGLVFLWPEFAPKRAFGMDGLLPVAVLHYVLGVLITAFTIAHIYLATTGVRVTSLVRMMITGWHEH